MLFCDRLFIITKFYPEIYPISASLTDIIILAMKFLPASGGSATYAYNLALGLHQQGLHVQVLAPSYGMRASDDSVYPFRIRRMRMTNESFFLIRHFVALLYVIIGYCKYKPRYIWATTYAGCAVLGMCRFSKSKTIGTVHGGGIHRRFPPKKLSDRPGNFFGLRFIRHSDAMVTVSKESRAMFLERLRPYNVLKDFHVIYNGIRFDYERFKTKSQALERFSEYAGKTVLLTVGRLVKAKGHDLVIQAVTRLLAEIPELIYIICGEGPEKASLITLAHRLSADHAVKFMGYVHDEDLEYFFGLCDVFVMAGRETEHFVEGFGLVYIEAGIRNKPVIGTRVGGIPEAVVHGQTGILIQPENVGELTDAIRSLVADPQERNRLAGNARTFIENNFTTAVMAKHNVDLLKQLQH